MNKQCKFCIHGDVCAYKEHYEDAVKLYEKVRNECGKYPWFKCDIVCVKCRKEHADELEGRLTIPFQEYKVDRTIPQGMENVDYYLEHLKKEMASDLFDDIEDNIVYAVHNDSSPITITASIFVGRK